MRQTAGTVTVAATTAPAPTASAPRTSKPSRTLALEDVAVQRFNAWWWTDERAGYLLEAKASSALHEAPTYANLRVRHAKCTGAGRTTRYVTRKPLAQRFTCTVRTFLGASGTTKGPTITVTVLALTRGIFGLYVQTGG